jgi:DNA-binding NarL/FixJ family response regulator
LGQRSATVVLAEGHFALQRGIEAWLRHDGHQVIGRADDVDAARRIIQRRRPELVIMDIYLPGGSGVDLTADLLADDPELKVLLYTGSTDPEVLREAVSVGARGVLLKTARPEQCREAVAAVLAGETYLDPELPSLLENPEADEERLLSPREAEIMKLLAAGLTGREVAGRLFLAEDTVRTHVRNMMRKLGARTRCQAVAMAIERGETEPLKPRSSERRAGAKGA